MLDPLCAVSRLAIENVTVIDTPGERSAVAEIVVYNEVGAVITRWPVRFMTGDTYNINFDPPRLSAPDPTPDRRLVY